jgi:hypothetical protein
MYLFLTHIVISIFKYTYKCINIHIYAYVYTLSSLSLPCERASMFSLCFLLFSLIKRALSISVRGLSSPGLVGWACPLSSTLRGFRWGVDPRAVDRNGLRTLSVGLNYEENDVVMIIMITIEITLVIMPILLMMMIII